MARATGLLRDYTATDQTCSFPKNKLFSASEEVHNVSPSEGGRRFCHSLPCDPVLHHGLESKVQSEDLLPNTVDLTCSLLDTLRHRV